MNEPNLPGIMPNDVPAIAGETPAVALALKNGTYTVSHPEHGHYTIKLHTVTGDSELAGKRIFSLLVGASNETDYEGVAFWNDDARFASVWKRHRSPTSTMTVDAYNWQSSWSKVEKKLGVLLGLALRERSYWHEEGYELLLEGRCVRCNRKLTTPESIRTGIGPECAKRER